VTTTIADVKSANPKWFTRDNKRFFNDVSYHVLHSQSKKAYLVRATYAWTDMFNPRNRRLHYRINEIDQTTLEVGSLIDDEFKNIDTVKDWLREN